MALEFDCVRCGRKFEKYDGEIHECKTCKSAYHYVFYEKIKFEDKKEDKPIKNPQMLRVVKIGNKYFALGGRDLSLIHKATKQKVGGKSSNAKYHIQCNFGRLYLPDEFENKEFLIRLIPMKEGKTFSDTALIRARVDHSEEDSNLEEENDG